MYVLRADWFGNAWAWGKPAAPTRRLRTLPFLLLPLLWLAFASAAQDLTLAVTGKVQTPLKLSLPQLKQLPVSQFSQREQSQPVSYHGVALADLLRAAGVTNLQDRGLTIAVKASDGYSAEFSPAELITASGNTSLLLAYERNGTALDAFSGPLHLIVPADARRARWVRHVREVEVMRKATP